MIQLGEIGAQNQTKSQRNERLNRRRQCHTRLACRLSPSKWKARSFISGRPIGCSRISRIWRIFGRPESPNRAPFKLRRARQQVRQTLEAFTCLQTKQQPPKPSRAEPRRDETSQRSSRARFPRLLLAAPIHADCLDCSSWLLGVGHAQLEDCRRIKRPFGGFAIQPHASCDSI